VSREPPIQQENSIETFSKLKRNRKKEKKKREKERERKKKELLYVCPSFPKEGSSPRHI
jgi:hypothetical protein